MADDDSDPADHGEWWGLSDREFQEWLGMSFKDLLTQARIRAYRVMRNWAEADDVAQETLIALVRMASRGETLRNGALPLMYTIVARRCVSVIRAKERARERDQQATDNDVALLAERHRPIDEQVIDQEFTALLRAKIDAQPEGQRKALMLALDPVQMDFASTSQAELAQELGITVGALKMRLQAGLKNLRSTLQPLLEGQGEDR